MFNRTRAISSNHLDNVIRKIIERMEIQGHVNTGRLRDSIEKVIEQDDDCLVAGVKLFDYWVKVDQGQRPEDLPANHEQNLVRYFGERGLRDGEDIVAARLTARIHSSTGAPTEGSYFYSRNGKRTGFLTDVVNEEHPSLEAALEQNIFEDIEKAFFARIGNIAA